MNLSAVFILLPVLLPVLGGLLLLTHPVQAKRGLPLYCEALICITSLLVWIAILGCSGHPVTVYNFTSGFSITFGADGLSCLFAGMISLMWPLVTIYAFSYMEDDDRPFAFFSFFIMTYGITLGVAFSADILTMYVFFEMLTLVTIPLVTHYGNAESRYAGRKYAVYTIGGASLAFTAVVLITLYGYGGDFLYGGIVDINDGGGLMLIAFPMGFFGFGVKAALFPLHQWLPDASVAPTPVTALLHAVAVVNSGVFAVIRLTYYCYRPQQLAGTWVQHVCTIAAVFTLLFAAAMALKERHFKRRLAYSTVSNLSYMLFGISLMTSQGMLGGMAHMLFHGIVKMCLFLCAGAFMHVTGNRYIYEVNGVGRRMPFVFTCYTLGALSLTGIPFFCCFISKWQLLLAGAEAGTVEGALGCGALILSAFLCAMYTITVSVRAFFPAHGKDYYANSAVTDPDWRMLVPIGVFTLVNIVFGLFPAPVMHFLAQIAAGRI